MLEITFAVYSAVLFLAFVFDDGRDNKDDNKQQEEEEEEFKPETLNNPADLVKHSKQRTDSMSSAAIRSTEPSSLPYKISFSSPMTSPFWIGAVA